MHAEVNRERNREWYAANKERKDAANREWAEANRGKISANSRKHLLTRYELEGEDFKALAEDQGGACAICAGTCSTGTRLSVDHDHQMKGRAAVRGLLCRRCNGLLGRAGDSVDWLRQAIRYLKERPARTQSILRERLPSGSPKGR